MLKYIVIFLIFITYSLSANEKIIEDIVKKYNVGTSLSKLELSEKELDLICDGFNHLSMYCEIKTIDLQNKIIEKRISYLLDKISKKYNFNKKLAFDIKNKFVKYITMNEKINGFTTDCASSNCSIKTISFALENFTSSLEFVLNDNSIEPTTDDNILGENSSEDYRLDNFSLNNLDNSYLENLELIKGITDSEEINSKLLKKNFADIEKSWKDYEISLNEFLKKTNKYSTKWIKLFYITRYHHLENSKNYFRELIGATENFDNLVLVELNKYSKNHNFFTNVSNEEIKHKFVKNYTINKNEIILLYKTTKEDFSCHICIPKMNWFHIKKEKNNWIIKNSIINKDLQLGSWGSFVIPKLIKIRDDFFLFKYDFSYSNQGFTESYIVLELYKNGKFNEIFKTEIGFDDTGAHEIPENDWQGRMTLIENKNSLPTLKIEKIGLKDSKEFYTNKIYEFHEDKYK